MNFGGNDLSGASYDLSVLIRSPLNYMPPIRTSMAEIGDKAYNFAGRTRPRVIRVRASVVGTNRADLQSNLDNISKVLNPQLGLQPLILDYPTDRYWQARVSAPVNWQYQSETKVEANIQFTAPDPLAFANSETNSQHNIDADPDTVSETPGGTAYAYPVWTLTAGEALGGVTLTLQNITTSESISWTGTVGNADTVTINSQTWVVQQNLVTDMASVTGQFPRLQPGTANSIKVTNFASSGTLDIDYRARYL